MRTTRLVVGLIALLASAGCAPDPDDSLSAAAPSDAVAAATQPVSEVTYPANGEQFAITALDNNFVPQTVSVAAGTEVVFTNNGRNPHDVLPAGDPNAITWGALEDAFQPEDVYSLVFDRPGTYVYYCSIHGTPTAAMYGTITVTEP